MQDIYLTFHSNRILARIVLRAAKGAGVGSGGPLLAPRQQGGATPHSLTGCREHLKPWKTKHCYVSLSSSSPIPDFPWPVSAHCYFWKRLGRQSLDYFSPIFKLLCFLCCCVFSVAKSFTSTKPECSFRLANFHACPCLSPLCLTAPVVLPPRLCVCESVSVCECMHERLAAAAAAAVPELHLFLFHQLGADGLQALHGPALTLAVWPSLPSSH